MSVAFQLVSDIWDRCTLVDKSRWAVPHMLRGIGEYYSSRTVGANAFGGLIFACPGCARLVCTAFEKVDDDPVWTWNGNRENPTLSPSIIHDMAKDGCGWHGFLTAGVFREA